MVVDIEGDSLVYFVDYVVIPCQGKKGKRLDIKQNKRKDYKKYKSSFYVSKITENQQKNIEFTNNIVEKS